MKKSSLSGLTARTIGNPVYYFESLDSTNRWLKENGNLMPHGTLCWTGFQTSGRGRLGRKWCAAKGQSVALSLLIKPSNKAALLPLICGIAVCDALQLLTGKTFQIKWPNDIICEGYKICGVLCENCLSEDGGYAVAGIGINLDQTAEDFTKSGLPRAGSVRMVAGRAPAPELVVASVMNRLEPLCLTLSMYGFSKLRDNYEKRCINIGREVRILSPDGVIQLHGVAVGITADGRLLVDSGSSIVPVNAGELSVRGKDGYF